MHIATNRTFKGFLSSHFILGTSNLNEVALVLSLIDLPSMEESHGFRSEQGRRVEIKAASNLILFLKEVQETKASIDRNLLVVHRYFETQNQKEEVKEYLVNQAYLCQVIVTNIANSRVDFQAFTQVPEGALPLSISHYQKSHIYSLESFSTLQFNIYFYFPKSGIYRHFPTNIAVNGEVVAKAQPLTMKV